MIIFPAIDIKEGRVVRLEEGDPKRMRYFHEDPLEQARLFEQAGFHWLHVVDLDAALGSGDNQATIRALVAASPLKVQLGGGIRTQAQAEDWLAAGAARIVIGTAAFRTPEWVEALVRQNPGRIVLALDAREGRVAIAGWQESAGESAIVAAKRFADWGAAAILYTDIARDGLLTGIDAQAQLAMARASSAPVIVSGGFSRMEDMAALMAARRQKEGEKIEGVVIGRAFYESRLDAAKLLAMASSELD